MRKTAFAALCAALAMPLAASADITVNLPAGSGLDSVAYYHAPIAKLATAKTRAERGIVEDKAPVKDNKATIAISSAEGGSRYGITFSQRNFIDLYVLPGEEVNIDVKSLDPFDYNLSGTEFINDMNEVAALSKPLEEKQKALMADGAQPDREATMALYNEYMDSVKDFIEENLTSPKAVIALMNLDGEDFVKAFDKLSERAKTSRMYPLAERQYHYVQASLEKERKQQAMANGTTPAPDFTLEDIDGKQVSLSQFKGKWVILDFWGSWCGWCIKGFPELKEAYTKYKDRLEVVGVDCQETKEAWLAGVKKYELPWVNVYNPEGSKLTEEYGVQGFPTKAIINPEGIIVNITTGHDPEFFTKLDQFMAK